MIHRSFMISLMMASEIYLLIKAIFLACEARCELPKSFTCFLVVLYHKRSDRIL